MSKTFRLPEDTEALQTEMLQQMTLYGSVFTQSHPTEGGVTKVVVYEPSEVLIGGHSDDE